LKGIEYFKGEGEEYKKGYNLGYAAAVVDIALGNKDAEERLNMLGLEFIPCIVCGKPLPGLVAMKVFSYEIKELAYKNGWRHTKCPIL
jgi:hypothetical protein